MSESEKIEQISYRPPGDYKLDLEVMPIGELKRRGSAEHFRWPQRVAFHLIIGITQGRCTHMVDFAPHVCAARTWLMLRPGQIQRYDFSQEWEGWLIVYRPEFLLPLGNIANLDELSMVGSLENLPNWLDLSESEHAAALSAVIQMSNDSRLAAPVADINALLRHQLYALLLRLQLSQQQRECGICVSPLSLQRFKRFRQAIEEGFRKTHQLHAYANRLGCSEKSLARASMEIAGVSAKAFLSQRIALEAKRLLAHTTRPVQVIAAELGFDEPTNFIKFFKREAGCAPGEFRRKNSGRE